MIEFADVVKIKEEPVFLLQGANLRLWREARGYGLREFARKIKISSTYLSRVELTKTETRISDGFMSRLRVVLMENPGKLKGTT